MKARGDFFDFLRFVSEKDPENRKYGKKILDILKSPKASPKELYDAFNSEGFRIPLEDCERLKNIDPDLIPEIDPVAGY